MDLRERANTASSIVSAQSGGPASTRESRLFGSRTSVSALPSLPNDTPITPTRTTSSPEAPPVYSSEAHNISHLSVDEPTPETSYVEFDFSSQYNSKNEDVGAISERVIPNWSQSQENLEVTHVSPKKDAPQQLPHVDDDFFSSSASNWKSMKTITELDYYDEKGELEFKSTRGFDSLDNRAGSRGYTKIDTEEQVAKYLELDKRTDFLFKASKDDIETKKPEDSDDEYDEELDSEETLETTKEMLTEAQKFAYVGICKLITVEMATELAKIKLTTSNKVARTLSFGQRNFSNWTMYITSKLYDHLDLNDAEKQMIENLSKHGVEATDLTESFIVEETGETNSVACKMAEKYPGFNLKWVVICDLFMVLLSDGYYDSRSNALLMDFSEKLGISNLENLQFQRRLLESLELVTNDKSIENRDELLNDRSFIEKHIKKNKNRKLLYIGLATLGGSLAIGLSAGLLAPVIGAGLAAGLTTVGITGTGGFLAGIGGSVIITTGGVVAGAKVGSKAGARRLGDVQTFELKPLHNNKRPNLIITISGWMNGQLDDVRLPFSTVDPIMGDMFSLLWEPEMLQSMGQTINILATEALTTSIQQILGATILTALMSAIQLPMALSKLSYLLDNPWNVSLDRAWKAGKILADTLISGNMGVRPITLVGFSLGARLLYSCLIELAKRGGYGLIENVIILGNPITVKTDQMALARSVVSGKFVNGYSKKDWILGYLFRATGGGLSSVAGIAPIEGVYGIENVDCTDLVEGHMSYRKAIPKILKKMNWEVLSEEFAEIEEPDPEQGERTRQLINEFDEARAKMQEEQETENKKKTWKDWFRPKQKDWWDIASKPAEDGSEQPAKKPENEGTEEYTVEPMFDVNALMSEINNIEDLATGGDEVLNQVRENVDTSHKVLTSNEEQEEEEAKTTFVGNLAKIIPGKN